jgi:hypothetical protein
MHVLSGGAGPVGALLAGALGQSIGLRWTLLMGVLSTMLASLWIFRAQLPVARKGVISSSGVHTFVTLSPHKDHNSFTFTTHSCYIIVSPSTDDRPWRLTEQAESERPWGVQGSPRCGTVSVGAILEATVAQSSLHRRGDTMTRTAHAFHHPRDREAQRRH